MDLSRLASFQSLLIVSCGDVERNPGPPKKEACKSEVLRQFMRSIQSDLVKLVYKANKQEPPKHLYKKVPPGWDAFEENTEFKNICNSKKEGNKTFDKLVKLCRRKVKGLIPKNILDVIVCYENLRDSKKDSDETKAWKLALENHVSQNKSMKNKSTIIDHVDDKLLIEIIQKGTEGVKQGIIGSSPEGIRDIFSALNGFIAAAEKNMEQMLKKPNTAGKKRSLTAEQEDAMNMIAQVKRKKKSFDCMCADAETTEKGKPKPKRNTGSKGKHHKAMVTQKSIHQTPQQLDTFMEIVPDPSGNQVNMVTSFQIPPPHVPELLLYSVPSNRQLQIRPHVEQQQMEPQQFELQLMEPQPIEPQQLSYSSSPCNGIDLEDFQLPFSPSPACSENDSEDFQGGSTRKVPMVQDTSDIYRTLPIQEDTTDCLSESSLEDEDLYEFLRWNPSGI